ncbi:MAG: hypothetical protein GQ525_12635 [Draconibacterium sp.]|nr:hypothetical protein [Draconibacterium sp.]
MKMILIMLIASIISISSYGNKKESLKELTCEKQALVQKQNVLTKHPKRMTFHGKVVTRDDYIKTSNPKRLYWNKIYEKNNPQINNVINNCPKRRNLVSVLSLEKKAGNPSNSFHKAKRHRHKISK